jgi:hypothetical protein
MSVFVLACRINSVNLTFMNEMPKTIYAKNENAGQILVSLAFLSVGEEVVRVYERDEVRGIGRAKHSSFVTHDYEFIAERG